MKINFIKCTNEMTINIIEHFYNKKIQNDTIFPAEIIAKCYK